MEEKIMKKRLLSFTLVLTAGLLAGCGNKVSQSDNAKETTKTIEQTETAKISNSEKALALINSFASGDTKIAEDYLKEIRDLLAKK